MKPKTIHRASQIRDDAMPDEAQFTLGTDAAGEKLMDFSGAKGLLMLANEVARLHRALPVWVIYDHPSDYPEGFIVRAHTVVESASVVSKCTIKAPLDDLRRLLMAAGLARIARDPSDDAKIVESWL